MTEFREIAIDLDVHRAIERRRQALDETENGILRRLLLTGPAARGTPRARAAGAANPHARVSRSRGLWSVEIAGRRLAAANLKDAYRVLLRALASAHPHFLECFAQEKERSRRFVARTPADLYARSPHLARHAQPLADGWYFDSNLSLTQVAKRARIAARLCGLHYGSEVRILDNLREI